MYLDTNIWSEIAANPDDYVSVLKDFLREKELIVAVSGPHLVELVQADRKHDGLSKVMTQLPCRFIKPAIEILEEEVRAYPNKRSEDLGKGPLFGNEFSDEGGLENLKIMLGGLALKMARQAQDEDAQGMQLRINDLMPNFPPNSNGKYTRDQADDYAYRGIIQNLSREHPEFLARQGEIKIHLFLSRRIVCYAVFNRYYINRRRVKKDSEYGDLMHLAPLPYCRLAVMEKHMCSDLKQIKSKHAILKETEIVNIDFLRKIKMSR